MPTALITGASYGIGLELARVFAREGYALVLVARSQKRLEEIAAELKPTPVQTVATDLTLADAPQELYRQAPKVDVLVNNAGFGVYGKFAETSLPEELNLMQLNMSVPVILTKLYLAGMLAQRSGRIMNVASTAAFQPGPLMALYYASKAFLLSFSEAINNELAGTGVTVTALCPGPTATEFQERAKIENVLLAKKGRMMDARAVAEAGYRGMLAGKAVVIPGAINKLLVQTVRVSPRSMVTKIVRKLQEESH
jgi:short-subunit dehydrogenase